jgi:hypothetical protein
MAGQKKPDKKTKLCLHDKIMQQADDYLAEIDEALGENTWNGPPRFRLRRSRGEQLGTTPDPESDLGS